MDYTLEIEIDAPREKVAALFADLDNLKFWQPGFISSEHISGEPGEPGSKARLLYKNGSRDVEMIETVNVINLPDEFTATFEATGMVMVVRSYFHEIDGGNRTQYVTENNCEVQGIVMKLMTILLPGCFRKQSYIFMENFKAFAETGADVRNKT